MNNIYRYKDKRPEAGRKVCVWISDKYGWEIGTYEAENKDRYARWMICNTSNATNSFSKSCNNTDCWFYLPSPSLTFVWDDPRNSFITDPNTDIQK